MYKIISLLIILVVVNLLLFMINVLSFKNYLIINNILLFFTSMPLIILHIGTIINKVINEKDE